LWDLPVTFQCGHQAIVQVEGSNIFVADIGFEASGRQAGIALRELAIQ
jgi:hypothetical protein